jgi:hypothetical protein
LRLRRVYRPEGNENFLLAMETVEQPGTPVEILFSKKKQRHEKEETTW